jgi:hypothetical protein
MKIAFTKRNGNIFSRMVQHFTESNWSHCFLVLERVGNDHLILESSVVGGVKFNVLSYYTKNDTVEYEIYDVPGTAFETYSVMDMYGDSYGYLQAGGYLIAKLLKLKKNPFTQGIWCSELVLHWLLDSPLKASFIHLPHNKVTPEDIYQIVKKNNHFRKLEQ